ncbi:MAG: DUF4870 domain-containing protein [Planctomycetota bacterium JB042]
MSESITADEQEARWWAVALHLSMLSSALVPLAGYVAPVLIWLIKRDEFPQLDRHGRNAVNWMITQLLLGVLAIVLFATILLIPVAWLLSIALYVAGIAFPILAAIFAKDGRTWRYPASLPIL